ncbi:hypothetical protein BD779DRAFT_878145 [Infundibulicybe gibba]|nr:hypothetical protein BD779DRAFT_878145 [Infundibulicybe gibba]
MRRWNTGAPAHICRSWIRGLIGPAEGSDRPYVCRHPYSSSEPRYPSSALHHLYSTMQIKSTLNPNASTKDIPIIILALVRTGPESCAPAEPRITTIVDRTFVRLPDTYPALVAQARTAFHLPPHSALQITTDVLDVCRGAPVRITEDVYGLLKGVLDYIRVEVAEESDGEGGNQNKGQRRKGHRGLGEESGEARDDNQGEQGGGEMEDGLDFVDVFVAGGAQQLEKPPSVASSNTHAKRSGQGTHVLQTKPKAQKSRALPSAAATPTPPSDSPASLPQPPPLVVLKEVGLSKDPYFWIHISGPGTTHKTTLVTCNTHLVSQVLEAAYSQFKFTQYYARLIMECPTRGRVLCPPEMTMEDCGAKLGSHFTLQVE